MFNNPDKIYKIYPINNSFKTSIDILLNKIIINDYDIINIKFPNTSLTPDGIKVGSTLSNFKKPSYLYVSLFIKSQRVELGSGFGQKYCTCELKNKDKIFIFWDSAISRRIISRKGYTIFNNITLRNLKLKNIENIN